MSNKGRWAFTDFAASPLPRAAAVATDTEWKNMVEAHWPRILEELAKSNNPAIRERLHTIDRESRISLPANHADHGSGLTEMSDEKRATLAAEMAAQYATLAMLIAGLHGSLQTRVHRSSLRRPIPPAPQREPAADVGMDRSSRAGRLMRRSNQFQRVAN